jgi:hypothetical protein
MQLKVFREKDENVPLPNAAQRLPAIFYVGTQRTATTWCWEIFKSHANLPEYYKETGYFSTNFDKGMKWYLSHYRNAVENRVTMDIDPDYFYHEIASKRIADLVPGAKIICSFREPVERLHSLYKLLARNAAIPLKPFEDIVASDYRFCESARYGTHLRRWIETFGCRNVLILFYCDLLSDAQTYVSRICRFLGVSDIELTPAQKQPVWSASGVRKPGRLAMTRTARVVGDWIWRLRLPLVRRAIRRMKLSKLVLDKGAEFDNVSLEAAAQIRRKLKPEIELLEELSDRDLSAWKN